MSVDRATAVECYQFDTAKAGKFVAVINPRRRVPTRQTNTARVHTAMGDACSYTNLTHYRQWVSFKAVGEHRGSPCRDNLRIVYASFLEEENKRKMKKKWWRIFLFVVVGKSECLVRYARFGGCACSLSVPAWPSVASLRFLTHFYA